MISVLNDNSVGGDAVLGGTPTKTALYSCNGPPFEREGQALRPFPTVGFSRVAPRATVFSY